MKRPHAVPDLPNPWWVGFIGLIAYAVVTAPLVWLAWVLLLAGAKP